MDEVEELPPGWYRQQTDPSRLRWWDGHDWTDDVLSVRDEELGRALEPPGAAGSDGPGRPSEPPTSKQQARRGREQLRPTPAPGAPDDTDDGAVRIRIRDDDAVPSNPTPTRPRPGPNRRPGPTPDRGGDPRRQAPAAAGRPGPRTGAPRQGARPDPAAGPRPSPRGAGAGGGRRPAPARRQGQARYAPQPDASPHVGRFAFRIVMVAAVAALAYILVKPFFDPPEEASTVASDVAPTTVVAEDGSFPDGTPPLSDAVLRLAELPPGWSTQAEIAGPRLGFCGGRNPSGAIPPAEELHATFSQGDVGPFLSSVTLRFVTDEEAEVYMDVVARILETCQQFQENGSAVTLEPSDFPKLGDETFAAHVLGENAAGTLEGDVVWVRRGARVFSISSIAFGDFDVDLVELLAERLARRL